MLELGDVSEERVSVFDGGDGQWGGGEAIFDGSYGWSFRLFFSVSGYVAIGEIGRWTNSSSSAFYAITAILTTAFGFPGCRRSLLQASSFL